MRAIILAAGNGSRLNGGGSRRPKCLVEVGGVTLIERQIKELWKAGIDDITVVVGYEAGQVRRACGSAVSYVENERYALTNSLYSLWRARHALTGACLIMNSDVLFHPQLLRDLLTAQHEDALLISYQTDNTPPYGDEEMKVKVRRGQVVEITKSMSPEDADGENVGVAKIGEAGIRLLVEVINALVAEGNQGYWVPRAFQEFAERRPLHAVGTRGYPWIEIDFPEDYERACTEVLPEIKRLEPNGLSAAALPAFDGEAAPYQI